MACGLDETLRWVCGGGQPRHGTGGARLTVPQTAEQSARAQARGSHSSCAQIERTMSRHTYARCETARDDFSRVSRHVYRKQLQYRKRLRGIAAVSSSAPLPSPPATVPPAAAAMHYRAVDPSLATPSPRQMCLRQNRSPRLRITYSAFIFIYQVPPFLT